MNEIQSKINVRSEDFKINQAAMLSLVDDLTQKAQTIALGGGEKARQNILIVENYYHVNVLINSLMQGPHF